MLERIYVFDGYAGWDPEVGSFALILLQACITTMPFMCVYLCCKTVCNTAMCLSVLHDIPML